jgi:uncharacterized protein YidB (DUF937 family)
MGLLDSVLGSVLGSMGGQQGGQQAGLGGGGNAALINMVVGMLANGSAQGGLGGLLQQFQRSGMGDVAASWVGTGQNQPISPDQITNVLGSDTISNMAQQLGMGHGDLAGQLSQILPQVVDHLTPNGQAPQGGLGDIAGILGQLMRK